MVTGLVLSKASDGCKKLTLRVESDLQSMERHKAAREASQTRFTEILDEESRVLSPEIDARHLQSVVNSAKIICFRRKFHGISFLWLN